MNHIKKYNEGVEESKPLTKIVVWFSISNGGDGSAYPRWFLTEEETEYHQDNMSEGWGECCNGSIETFMGSDVHRKAMANSEELAMERGL